MERKGGIFDSLSFFALIYREIKNFKILNFSTFQIDNVERID